MNRLKNVFIFNQKYDLQKVKTLNKYGKSVYFIDSYGNIKVMLLPKKNGLYKFNKNKHAEILTYLLLRQSIVLKSFIKKFGGFERKIFLREINNAIHEYILGASSFDKDNLRLLYTVNLKSMYSLLDREGKLKRGYERKDPFNSVINLFHSLSIANITTYLIENGIDVNQNLLDFFPLKDTYPAFSRLFFELSKPYITYKAFETFKKLLTKEDFSNGSLNKEGLLIVSKVFTESVVHGKDTNNWNLDLIKELKNIENNFLKLTDLLSPALLKI